MEHLRKQSTLTSPVLACPFCRDREVGVCGQGCRAVGPQGAQLIGSNPWSLQPKMISHVAPSAWVTDLKDRTVLYHLSFHLFQLCYFLILVSSVQWEITDISTYSTSRRRTNALGTLKSCLCLICRFCQNKFKRCLTYFVTSL